MKKKDLIQRSDNTRVDIGTSELPKWEVPFVPDYLRGEEEYRKGNYTNPHAKAYADKISGKVESVSPEFELLSALGLSKFRHLITPIKNINSPYKGFFKNVRKRTGNTDYKYTGGEEHLTRVKNGSYKNLNLKESEALDALENLYNPVNLDNYDVAKLSLDFNIPKKSAQRILNERSNMFFQPVTDRDGLIFYRGSKIDQNTFNHLLPHEVHHGLSYKSFGKGGNPIDFPDVDKSEFMKQASEEGIKSKSDYYNYMLREGAEEMAARGVQLKDALGITKDRLITEEELKNLSKSYPKEFNNNMSAFFSLIGNNYKDWAKWLSTYATSQAPIMISKDEE